jgi:hypothetical protein
VAEHRVVRLPLMRSTIHAVTADDACLIRPLVQPAIERTSAGVERRALDGVDMADLAAATRALVATAPRTPAELDRLLGTRWPDRERNALANAARTHVPLVQVPPRGLWNGHGAPTLASLEDWVARPLAVRPDIGELIVRYLRAFGPASPADFRAWSGVAIPGSLMPSLRRRLVIHEDEAGRELLDIPDGPLPDADTPAPIRFLPVYDNIVLGHRDRSRIVPSAVRSALPLTNENIGSVLVDGIVAARWQLRRKQGEARLRVDVLDHLPGSVMEEIGTEAGRLLAFLTADAAVTRVEVRGPGSA